MTQNTWHIVRILFLQAVLTLKKKEFQYNLNDVNWRKRQLRLCKGKSCLKSVGIFWVGCTQTQTLNW